MRRKNKKMKHPWARHNVAEARFNDGEYADLKILAEAWGITVDGLIWGVITTWLQVELRDRDIFQLPYRDASMKILWKLRAAEREASDANEEAGQDEEQGSAHPKESWEEQGYGVLLRETLPGHSEQD